MAEDSGERLIFLRGQEVLGRDRMACVHQGPSGFLAGTAIPTGRAGAHLFSMACKNSSKVRKGVPSPQMPRRLM